MLPIELKNYSQWLLWRSVTRDGKITKLPYSATGSIASVTDKQTWSSYETIDAASKKLDLGLGFVLTDNDPFAFIDLDDPKGDPTIIARQMKIAEAFDSYSEISPSGTGLHIIVKGAVPKGRKRDKVEIYSTRRYMTVTGNTYQDKPIEDRGGLLRILWDELGEGSNTDTNGEIAIVQNEITLTDAAIYHQAKEASNGDKFMALWSGDWQQYYKSQSEADFALIDILGFYTRNVEQIKSLFFASALGQRDKAKRKTYVDNMVKRSFDNQPAAIDFEEVTAHLKTQLEEAVMPVVIPNPFAGPLFANLPDPQYDWTMPPGLLGDLTSFIYQSAPRPVKEIALAAAIGLMAGICGRQYNVSGTGLNQYILVLAKTGTGKEAAASGIDKLMRYVKLTVPAVLDFIGPNEIASGQALVKYLGKHTCFVSVVGEFGLMLQTMCSANASTAQVSLRRKLLELYNKSGATDSMQPTIYSDKEKNTQVVQSPAFSLLGESTPESYYSGLDEGLITQGLLPRFMCIEYNGDRPPLNESHTSVEPSQQLVAQIAGLAASCLEMSQLHRVVNIELDTEATTFAAKFEVETTTAINASNVEVAKQLWNRAHLKMLKLSGLIAIGINAYSPVITLECIKWAHTLVERDINNILKRFEKGQIGKETSEQHQIDVVAEIIGDYLLRPFDSRLQSYGVSQVLHRDRVIAKSYLSRRLLSSSAFKNDRIGSNGALKRSIEALIAEGVLKEIKEHDMISRYKSSATSYMILDASRFT